MCLYSAMHMLFRVVKAVTILSFNLLLVTYISCYIKDNTNIVNLSYYPLIGLVCIYPLFLYNFPYTLLFFFNIFLIRSILYEDNSSYVPNLYGLFRFLIDDYSCFNTYIDTYLYHVRNLQEYLRRHLQIDRLGIRSLFA